MATERKQTADMRVLSAALLATGSEAAMDAASAALALACLALATRLGRTAPTGRAS